MVVSCLVSARFSRRNDPNSIVSWHVDYNQNQTQGISTESTEARLILRIRILDGDAKGITERLLGVPCAKPTRCLRKLAAAFAGSNSISMRQVCI